MAKINITAENVKVYVKQKQTKTGGTFNIYSIPIVTKKQDGSWESIYQPVRFKKGVNLGNKTIININSAFPSFDPSKKEYPFWFVMDFTVVEDGESTLDVSNLNELPFA